MIISLKTTCADDACMKAIARERRRFGYSRLPVLLRGNSFEVSQSGYSGSTARSA